MADELFQLQGSDIDELHVGGWREGQLLYNDKLSD